MNLLVILFQWIFYKIIFIFASLDFTSVITAYSYLFMLAYFKYCILCVVLFHFYLPHIFLIKTNFPQFQFICSVFIILLYSLNFYSPMRMFIFPYLFTNILFIYICISISITYLSFILFPPKLKPKIMKKKDGR